MLSPLLPLIAALAGSLQGAPAAGQGAPPVARDVQAAGPRRVPDSLPATLPVGVPYGLPEDLFEREPSTEAALGLGRALFFDPILSQDRTVACSSCHDPRFGFSDPVARSVGIGGQLTQRNAPTLFNRALGESFFWDGRATSLEEQVLMPISNETEMGPALEPILQRLRADAGYAQRFREALGGEPSQQRLAVALAAFVRRLTHANSAVDRFRKGEYGVLSDDARAGMWIFESSGRCWKCHSGPNFSDESFHNTGIGVRSGIAELGRFEVSGVEAERGAFKTPTLRGLSATAPYMHDGSLASLAEVVEFYRQGGHPNPDLDEELAPLELTERGARSLVAFLEALSQRPEDTPAHSASEAAPGSESGPSSAEEGH